MRNINLLFLLAALFFFTSNQSLLAAEASQITTNFSVTTDSLLSIVTISDLPNRPLFPRQRLADFRHYSFYSTLNALPVGVYTVGIETESGVWFCILEIK